jgi:sad1-interacting factor 2
LVRLSTLLKFFGRSLISVRVCFLTKEEPLYAAARSYLEIQQRIDLLNIRVEVLQDMLQLLKDQVTSSHSEWLEIIVIILIVLEYVYGDLRVRIRATNTIPGFSLGLQQVCRIFSYDWLD